MDKRPDDPRTASHTIEMVNELRNGFKQGSPCAQHTMHPLDECYRITSPHAISSSLTTTSRYPHRPPLQLMMRWLSAVQYPTARTWLVMFVGAIILSQVLEDVEWRQRFLAYGDGLGVQGQRSKEVMRTFHHKRLWESTRRQFQLVTCSSSPCTSLLVFSFSSTVPVISCLPYLLTILLLSQHTLIV
ncbi:hypothetical protein CBOM_08087 [Ceraceosorus bombacis]|uniref:Uncharacterized protein n=1 Tax=Ceraceosorus bombacis TaxID=401625 RepID=A0A0P1BSW5_9BASI|nr:hypothetical protein CBOM_08087 [Ceraceosorus bombacis]